MTTDAQLLREYAEAGSEEAFRQLVQRHVDLVCSTARRLVGGDWHLTEDVAQTVFTDLARKAGKLESVVVLGGWLHRHTCFVASKAVRSERWRQAHEKEASEMNALNGSNGSETAWRELAPLLDQAINRLGRLDRAALVLRFFHRQDLRNVGLALGLSEDAAQKRVSRALEKLRSHLARRGANLSTGVLAGLLGAHAVSSAPAALTASLTGLALASAAASGAGIGGLLLHLMTTPKIALVGAAAMTALLTTVIVQHRRTAGLLEQNAALRAQVQQTDQARAENGRLADDQQAEELARLRGEHSELMRLRGEVSLLRHRARAVASAAIQAPDANPKAGDNPSPLHSFVATLQSTLDPGQTLITGGWPTKPGKRTLVFVTPQLEASAGARSNVLLKTMFVEGAEDTLAALGLAAYKADGEESSLGGLLNPAEADSLFAALKQAPGIEILSAPRVTTADGQQTQVAVTELRGVPGTQDTVPIGPMIDLLPRLSPDGKAIDLVLQAKLNLLDTPKPTNAAADQPIQP
jgi:RNA polymerase sigma factor (sigma-70 family)